MGCGSIVPIIGHRCFNLVQNPSFEAGLAGWTATDNVDTFGTSTFEGTQVARMGIDVASMFQDIPLAGTDCSPLLLSFNMVSQNQPKFTVEVLWLDSNHNYISTGLRMYICDETTNSRPSDNSRVTFFDITDAPPAGAVFARLLFSKDIGFGESTVSVDQVILVPVSTINLVKNYSFELGLTNWTTTIFEPNFDTVLQGAASAATTSGGTLFQDIPIDQHPANSSYLFSFGVHTEGDGALNAKVLWLDADDNIIGTGLEIVIPGDTLALQQNYLTYLDITDSAALGAVKARILFEAVILGDGTLNIDQVILARVSTDNLIQNPSFEEGANGWTLVDTGINAENAAYEGQFVAHVTFTGGAFFQDVPLDGAEGHCYLLNYGLKVLRASGGGVSGNILARVLWLDNNGVEISLGLSIFSEGTANPGSITQWLVFTGITEPAPPGTAAARIQFTKPRSINEESFVQIDKVVFGRLT